MTDHTERPRPSTRLLIRGFDVSQREDGKLQARALYEITPTLAEFGCKEIIEADTIMNLEVLCTAERIKVDLINGCEDPLEEIQRATESAQALARYLAAANLQPYAPHRRPRDGRSEA